MYHDRRSEWQTEPEPELATPNEAPQTTVTALQKTETPKTLELHEALPEAGTSRYGTAAKMASNTGEDALASATDVLPKLLLSMEATSEVPRGTVVADLPAL